MSSDITISGIQAFITNSPRTMVFRVFAALGISELAVDVLSVRSLTRKDVFVVSNRQRRSAVGISSMSFVVTLKSMSIRDPVICKNCEMGNCTIKQILALDQPSSIFVIEFLASSVYGLLRHKEAVAANQRYKHVWVRSGEICILKLNGYDIIVVRSDLDLKKLE